jgi:hypothetical protein
MAYSYEKIKNLLSYAVALNPDGAFPLDARAYFGSLTEAQTAAAGAKEAGSSESAYFFGQQLYVVENDKVTTYLIQTDGTLKEVGAVPRVDGNSIELKVNEETDEKYLTLLGLEAAKEGASLVKGADGKISWSATTQSDLNANLAEIENDIDELQEIVVASETGLVSKVSALETKLENTGAIFNFAGSLTEEAFGNIELNGSEAQYQPGDVVLVNGKAEYVCVKDHKDTYVVTSDEVVLEGKKFYTKDAEGKYIEVDAEDLVDANPAAEGYYEIKNVEYLRWEAFGDPAGVEELTNTVEKLTDTVDEQSLAIEGLEDDIENTNTKIGDIGTKNSETSKYTGHTGLYQHVHDYVVEYADKTAQETIDYIDDLVSGTDGIADQLVEIDNRVADVETFIKDNAVDKDTLTQALTKKADANNTYTIEQVDDLLEDYVLKQTYNDYIAENDNKVSELETASDSHGTSIAYLQSLVGHEAGKNADGTVNDGITTATGFVATIADHTTAI